MGKKMNLLLIPISFLISACTPPIPPEVLASYAEQEVLCAQGDVVVKGSTNTQNVIQSGIDLYLSSCPEANVTFDLSSENPNLIVSDLSVAEPEMCPNPELTTSLMNQFSTLVYYGEGLDGIFLTSEAAYSLLTGEITNWNDPLIQESNPELVMPDIPVNFLQIEKFHASDIAFITWLETSTGKKINLKPQKVIPDVESLLSELSNTNGSFALLPSNVIYDNALTYANFKNGETQFLFDSTSFANAASQVFIEEKPNSVIGYLDPEVMPEVNEQNDPLTSWQAISYFNIALCNDTNNAARTFMRFLTRLDAQGQLETFGYFPLTETLRTKIATKIGETLPTPSIDPSITQE